eukprot:6177506-Pleurochrysis_carterae.AAC.1
MGNEEIVAKGFDGGDVLHERRLRGFSCEGVAGCEGVDFRDNRRAIRQVVLEGKECPVEGDKFSNGDGDAQVLRGEWCGFGESPEGPAHDSCNAR